MSDHDLRIMLACAAGMSTSMLVQRMEQAAKDQGKNYKIWAVDQTAVEGEMGNFDVLLLGPQVRHILKKIKGIVGDTAPVDVINPMDYGRGNGAAVIAAAEKMAGR